MKFRPIVAAGMGIAAAVALSAAASPALAAPQDQLLDLTPQSQSADVLGGLTSLLDVSGNQGAVGVGVFDNQGGLQLAGGQVLEGQGNLNPDGRLFSNGDIGTVAQGNRAAGAASDQSLLGQRINLGGTGPGSLLGVIGNQVSGLVNVADNQVGLQGAVGQLGLAQINANAPIRAASAGDNGDVWQTNWAKGSGDNSASATQAVNRGGVGRHDLLGLVGNSAGLVNVSDNQLVGQLAGGQIGLLQLNVNAPIRVVSPGDNGTAHQSNWAGGEASNDGSASQSIDHGGVGSSSLLDLVGNEVGLVDVADQHAGVQLGTGQAAVLQGNVNLPVRVASPGADPAPVQSDSATNSTSNSAAVPLLGQLGLF
jgi:hypothetical protein